MKKASKRRQKHELCLTGRTWSKPAFSQILQWNGQCSSYINKVYIKIYLMLITGFQKLNTNIIKTVKFYGDFAKI